MTARFFLTFFLAAAAVGSTADAKPILKPELMGAEIYTEQFVAFADLSDGTYVQVHFGISNVGPGDGKAACKYLVVEPDGSSWTDSKVVEREKWRHEASPVERLVVGDCEIVAGKQFKMTAPLPKGKITLTLMAAAGSERRPAMSASEGSDFYNVEILVPWAEAHVEIVKGEAKPRKLRGYGYADHPRSKILPGKLARKWVRFRGLNGKDSKLVLIRYPSGSGKPVGFYLEQGSDEVDLTRVALKPGAKVKDDIRAWRVLLDGGDTGPWRINSGRLLYRYDPAAQHGMLGSLVGAFVGKPITYTYRAQLESKKTKKRTSGILEITLISN